MKLSTGVLFVALLATGCASETPVPDTYPLTSQKKLKSAHHWDVIARDTAEKTVAELLRHSFSTKPIMVAAPKTSTAFQTGFRSFLLTHLVNLGQPVARQDAETEVQVETQLVRHPSPRQHPAPDGLTLLTAGILVANQAAWNWSAHSLKQGALALAGAADWYKGSQTGMTQTEVIVTTSVTRNNQFLMRKTDVYYIEDEDGALFEHMKQWKEWRVMG